jgi:hypothetical protein
MPEALQQMLAALAKLSSADRNAILRQLSPEERTALEKLAKAPIAAKTLPPSAKTAPPLCSPWLAKRLTQLADERVDGPITPAARRALRELLAGAGR